jgi:hypothetical protein
MGVVRAPLCATQAWRGPIRGPRGDGRDLCREEVTARRALAYVPESPDLTPYATVLDVLLLVAHLRGESSASARRRRALGFTTWCTARFVSSRWAGGGAPFLWLR